MMGVMTARENDPTIILVPGHWLGAWTWDEVVERLHEAGRRAIPLILPGLDPQDPQRASRTLDDQAAAIEETLAAHRPAILVAHSGANAPVTVVLDRHPEWVSHVVWVDSGPVAPGSVFASEVPAELVELPLPDFEVLAEQASLEGLDTDDLVRISIRDDKQTGPVQMKDVKHINSRPHAMQTTN